MESWYIWYKLGHDLANRTFWKSVAVVHVFLSEISISYGIEHTKSYIIVSFYIPLLLILTLLENKRNRTEHSLEYEMVFIRWNEKFRNVRVQAYRGLPKYVSFLHFHIFFSLTEIIL